MTKKEIRKIELDKRIQLSPQELKASTALIADRFQNLPDLTCHYLLSYYPLKERNEFDVAIGERILKEKNPSLQVAWPKIDVNTSSMEAHLIEKSKLFTKNKFNILEPLDGDIVPSQSIDIVFVPLIAFDRRGFRVGYGKGFYDRYLPGCRRDAIKLGFSFFNPVERVDDISEFDVPLTLCITPTGVYEF